jgi:hypothetical protein
VPLLSIYYQLLPRKKLPKFSKNVDSWKLPFFSKFYSSWKLRFRFPVISCALPKISKNVGSWKRAFQEFPKMLAAGKTAASYHLLLAFSKKKFSKIFQKC